MQAVACARRDGFVRRENGLGVSNTRRLPISRRVSETVSCNPSRVRDGRVPVTTRIAKGLKSARKTFEKRSKSARKALAKRFVSKSARKTLEKCSQSTRNVLAKHS